MPWPTSWCMPAHDYVLKCSHIFNVLDARGAIGVTERARYFVRMRDLARQVTALYPEAARGDGLSLHWANSAGARCLEPLPAPISPPATASPDFVLEIGCEELPVADLDVAWANRGQPGQEPRRGPTPVCRVCAR